MPQNSMNESEKSDKRQVVGLLLAFWWVVWSVWVWSSNKTPAMIFGLVAVGLLLLVLSIFFWKGVLCGVVEFTVMLVMLPFYSAMFVVSFLQALMSLLFVFSVRLPWKPSSRCDSCRLCDKCDALVGDSYLILGSPWSIAWPVERYRHHSRLDLQSSSQKCHLCLILYSNIHSPRPALASTASTGRDHRSPRVSSMGTTDAETGGTPPSDGTQPDDRMVVRIRKKIHFLPELPTVHLQICGPYIKGYKTELKWKPKGALSQMSSLRIGTTSLPVC